ncbi:MAG: hypothetical protein XD84_0370 [Desulfotomaculum sp. 46_80]|nr:MAG: hypothetical protein XD84_0370 [Desulfotomaculum sp. 46_80]HAU31254.1 hypothetical protein [Desulfotomaculum sp.]
MPDYHKIARELLTAYLEEHEINDTKEALKAAKNIARMYNVILKGIMVKAENNQKPLVKDDPDIINKPMRITPAYICQKGGQDELDDELLELLSESAF